MGDTERPVPERLGDQEEQAQHLVRTGNGPTVEDEAALLAEAYGPADMAGYHTGPEVAVDDQDDKPEPADGAEDDAPTAADQDGGTQA
ncbi:hypothetical protein [Streptomyces sp. A13(2022)]|uniref:hypothetical protein n=1 Tax=Streptomyces sp. A13(2022) TaxID=2964768 RepID=UPI0021D97BA4|nr:hypothetical protein [Streptomyces sp. A13(2022)]MCU8589914.1 hypothetical protein [Streptomyces sp. A13(2022)]